MNKILMFLIASALMLSADSIKVGSSLSILDNYKYETPHGRIMKVPSKSKLVIVAFDKDTGALVNNFLNTKGKYYLQKNHSIFIADINKMPTVITNMFALPKMRKYKHLLYLHYGEEFQNVIPHQDDRLTLLRVKDGKISMIYYARTKEEIQSAIEQ